MIWNHRLVRITDNGETFFAIQEVYYNDAGEPTGHGDPFMHGDSMEEIETLVRRMGVAITRPVLDSETDFNGKPDV